MVRKLFKNFTLQAFTLIELLVSISIMAIILGITLSGGPQAIMRLSLSDATYTAELSIREAQLQGSAINSLNDTYGGAGVYFDLASTTYVSKFRDRVDPTIKHSIGVGNGLYDQSGVDELDVRQVIAAKHRVAKLCVRSGVGAFVCNDANVPPISNLTISFTRPSQNTQIYINNSTTTNYGAACIQIDSLKAPAPGYVRSILVYKSGMITKRLNGCDNI